MDDVQGGLQVGREDAEERVEVVREAHGSLRRHDEHVLVGVVDEDGVPGGGGLDVRSSVEDMSDDRVTVFDREPVAPCEGGEIQRQILGNLAAVDEHLGACAHGRGQSPDADLAGSGRRNVFGAELRRAGGREPE